MRGPAQSSMPVTWVDISNFHPSRLKTWRKQLLALGFDWPLTFLARHHAGPFINMVRQNPPLQFGPSKSRPVKIKPCDLVCQNPGLSKSSPANSAPPVGELKNHKSVVNFEQEGCIFHLYGEQKPLSGLSPIFGGRGPRRNHAVQIWWRSVQEFLVGWGSNFAFSYRLWRSSLQHSHYRVRCESDLIYSSLLR